MLPEKVEVSNVYFQCNGKDLVCSFIPSIGAEDITYSVIFFSHGDSFPNVTAVSEYENGICLATIDVDSLVENVEYSVVLCMEREEAVRNLTLADVFSFEENNCSWQGLE